MKIGINGGIDFVNQPILTIIEQMLNVHVNRVNGKEPGLFDDEILYAATAKSMSICMDNKNRSTKEK